MRITFIGPGAIGCLFAALLKHAKEKVLLLDKNKERAACLQGQGIKVSGLTKLKIKVDVSSDYKKIAESELVVFTVKAYDLEKAAREAKKFAGKGAFFMGLQNGLGNVEILNRFFGKDKVISAVTNQGSTLKEKGYCFHAGLGKTYLGSLGVEQEVVLKKIEEIFNKASIATEIRSDIDSLIWGKLVVNAGINAVTGICRIKNGWILKIPEAKILMSKLCGEAGCVAKELGIKLPYPDAFKYTAGICRKTADNCSSMLQDIQRGRKTEIDFINGALIKEGGKIGLSLPYNEVVTRIIKVIEQVNYH